MDDQLILPLILYLQSLSGEILSLISFGVGMFLMLIMMRSFGVAGLYIYSSTATVMANIQVLKLMSFSNFPEPVALGTATFSTVFLANDIIIEHFGRKAATRNIWLCFATQILVAITMITTIGFNPVAGDIAHEAILILFLPAPRILIASLTAFVISQFLNIIIFQTLLERYKEKKLWLRSNAALMISELIDNFIFSVLAWVILAPNPVSLHSLIFTYILGTYILRVIFSLFSTPIIYWSSYFKPREE
ncbi:MAG: queuosine precursor transporter [Pseudomonadota bacterium]